MTRVDVTLVVLATALVHTLAIGAPGRVHHVNEHVGVAQVVQKRVAEA
jgi:hypothetical protein